MVHVLEMMGMSCEVVKAVFTIVYLFHLQDSTNTARAEHTRAGNGPRFPFPDCDIGSVGCNGVWSCKL